MVQSCAEAPLPHEPAHLEECLRFAKRRLTEARASVKLLAARGYTRLTYLARAAAPAGLGPRLRRLGNEARALASPYSHDEREALALLFLPFLLVAYAIVVHQSVRTVKSTVVTITIPDDNVSPIGPVGARSLALTALQRSTAREATPARATLTAVRTAPEARSASPARRLDAAPITAIARSIASPDTRLAPASAPALASTPDTPATEAHAETTLALLAPAGEFPRSAPPLAPDPIEVLEADQSGNPIRPGICAIDQIPRSVAPAAFAFDRETRAPSSEAFGFHLAKAAESQVGAFVIYNDSYRRISFPMGDVHRLYGVCTDVIVRAYRALGIDLQALVHQTRAGRGDTNIDQRRTEVLRRFFAREGETLPVTTFPEDYRAGDIVTYYRPQNRRTRAHIAIVSSVIAPSGRPMIVHNRGWGPELEDALFVDTITGHYRYRGPALTRNAAVDRSATPGGPHETTTAAGAASPLVPAAFPAQGTPQSTTRH